MKVVSQRELTPDEVLWLDMRADAIKQTPARVSDALARLLTLATAMAGGALGVLKDDVCAPWGRVGAAALFCSALMVAVVGTLPRAAALPPLPGPDLRAAVRRAVGFKEACARAAAVLLALGTLCAVLGVAARAA